MFTFSKGSLVRIPLAEKILFAKHLAMMVNAGMSELESLRMVRHQVKRKGFGNILDEIIEEVENGQFLSDALRKYKGIFGELFVNVLRIGEMTGALAENLNYLAHEMRKSQQLRSKVVGSLIYPAILFIASVAIVILLVFFVFPKVIQVFANSNVPLPIATRALIVIVTAFNTHYLIIAGAAIALIILFFIARRIPLFRKGTHRLLIGTPVIGRIAVNYNMATITRTLGVLLKSQIKIVESLQATSKVLDNLIYKQLLLDAAEHIRRGESLYQILETEEKFFTPTVSRMIEVGEKTGNLESNLFYLADFYENEVDEALKNLSTVLEPALLLVMGFVVGFVALAIITPIYGITQTIK